MDSKQKTQSTLLTSSSPDPNQQSNKQWVVAVTTAPRKECTLTTCLASLQENGWEPTVFAEPGSTLTPHLTIHNPQRLGVWHNWLSACRWALGQDRNDETTLCNNGVRSEYSTPDLILTAQDDTLFHPDSKVFIEQLKWPSNAAFVSLYTPKHYSIDRRNKLRPPGITRITTHSLWGACALVFQPETLRKIIEHPWAKAWFGAHARSGNPNVLKNRKANPHLIANSDTAIGKIVNAMRMNMYFVDPSPVAHIAKYSVIGHGTNTGRRNALRIADHSLPLHFQVYPPK